MKPQLKSLKCIGIESAVGSLVKSDFHESIVPEPPASRSTTSAPAADSRFASTQPAEPAPTIT